MNVHDSLPHSDLQPLVRHGQAANPSMASHALRGFELVTNVVTAAPNLAGSIAGSASGGFLGGLVGALVPGLNARHMAAKGAEVGSKVLSGIANVLTVVPALTVLAYSALAVCLGGAKSLKEAYTQANQVTDRLSGYVSKQIDPEGLPLTYMSATDREDLPLIDLKKPSIEVKCKKDPVVVVAKIKSDSSLELERKLNAKRVMMEQTSTLENPRQFFLGALHEPTKAAYNELNTLKNKFWGPKDERQAVNFKTQPHSDNASEHTYPLQKLNQLRHLEPEKVYTLAEEVVTTDNINKTGYVQATGDELIAWMSSAKAGSLHPDVLSREDVERISKGGLRDAKDREVAHERYVVVGKCIPTYRDQEYNLQTRDATLDRNKESAYMYVSGIDFQALPPAGIDDKKMSSFYAKYIENDNGVASLSEYRYQVKKEEVKEHFTAIFSKAVEEAEKNESNCLVLTGIGLAAFAPHAELRSELKVLFMESLADVLGHLSSDKLKSVVISDSGLTALVENQEESIVMNPEQLGNRKKLPDNMSSTQLDRVATSWEILEKAPISVIFTNAETGSCEHAALETGQKPMVLVAADPNGIPGYHANGLTLGHVAQDEGLALRNNIQMFAASPVFNPYFKYDD